eukprot:scaffold1786_cov398-Prasinococcus_capsulatus_cf.AAC.18
MACTLGASSRQLCVDQRCAPLLRSDQQVVQGIYDVVLSAGPNKWRLEPAVVHDSWHGIGGRGVHCGKCSQHLLADRPCPDSHPDGTPSPPGTEAPLYRTTGVGGPGPGGVRARFVGFETPSPIRSRQVRHVPTLTRAAAFVSLRPACTISHWSAGRTRELNKPPARPAGRLSTGLLPPSEARLPPSPRLTFVPIWSRCRTCPLQSPTWCHLVWGCAPHAVAFKLTEASLSGGTG